MGQDFLDWQYIDILKFAVPLYYLYNSARFIFYLFLDERILISILLRSIYERQWGKKSLDESEISASFEQTITQWVLSMFSKASTAWPALKYLMPRRIYCRQEYVVSSESSSGSFQLKIFRGMFVCIRLSTFGKLSFYGPLRL